MITPGLDVTLPPYRPVGISGEPQENLYVLGLQLSSVQWGTAIAAEAGSPAAAGSRTLRDADDIAAALLASAARNQLQPGRRARANGADGQERVSAGA